MRKAVASTSKLNVTLVSVLPRPTNASESVTDADDSAALAIPQRLARFVINASVSPRLGAAAAAVELLPAIDVYTRLVNKLTVSSAAGVVAAPSATAAPAIGGAGGELAEAKADSDTAQAARVGPHAAVVGKTISHRICTLKQLFQEWVCNNSVAIVFDAASAAEAVDNKDGDKPPVARHALYKGKTQPLAVQYGQSKPVSPAPAPTSVNLHWTAVRLEQDDEAQLNDLVQQAIDLCPFPSPDADPDVADEWRVDPKHPKLVQAELSVDIKPAAELFVDQCEK